MWVIKRESMYFHGWDLREEREDENPIPTYTPALSAAMRYTDAKKAYITLVGGESWEQLPEPPTPDVPCGDCQDNGIGLCRKCGHVIPESTELSACTTPASQGQCLDPQCPGNQ